MLSASRKATQALQYVLAVVLLSAAVYVVLGLKIGPVVLTLTRTHGVHSGDLFAFPLLAGAVYLAVTAFRSRRGR